MNRSTSFAILLVAGLAVLVAGGLVLRSALRPDQEASAEGGADGSAAESSARKSSIDGDEDSGGGSSDGTAGEPEIEDADASGAGEGATEEYEEPRPVRTETTPEDDETLARLEEELAALELADVPDAARYRALLEELAALGTSAALDLLLEIAEKRSLSFEGKDELIGRLLLAFDDERIGPAVARVIEEAIDRRSGSWLDLRGYLEWLEVRGGPDDAEALLEFVEADFGSIAQDAADRISSLEGRLDPGRVFDLAERDPSRAPVLLAAIARWSDPEIVDRVRAQALEPGLDVRIRADLCRRLGRDLEASEVNAFLAPYWDSADEADAQVLLAGIRGLTGNVAVDAETKLDQALPILRDAMESDTRDTRRAALVALADDPAYYTDEVLAQLRELAETTGDREEAVTVERIVQRIEAQREKR